MPLPPRLIYPAAQAEPAPPAPPPPTQAEHVAGNAWVLGGLSAGVLLLLGLAWWSREDQRRRGVLR